MSSSTVSQKIQIQAQESARLDAFLAEVLPDQTRSYIQSLIQDGHIRINGEIQTKKSTRLKGGEEVEVLIPAARPMDLKPVDLGLEVLFEDMHFVGVHKPAGVLTHPNHEGHDQTLVHGLLHQIGDLAGIHGELRPGIVHRLDRDTSGLLLVAKSDPAQLALQNLFSSRKIAKHYYALCHGKLQEKSGEIEKPLGRDPRRRTLQKISPDGRNALTRYTCIRSWGNFHLMRIQILTGRTHQIRVHMKSVGLPVVGDQEYGGRLIPRWSKRFLLHSFSLRFVHPLTQEKLYIRCPLPQDMRQVIQRLNRGEIHP